jgi:aminomethyltransferase
MSEETAPGVRDADGRVSEGERTPLARAHARLGARMVEFAGFQMPLQYSSIRQEHAAVREAVGLFDVSHMGQIRLEGPGASVAADALLSRSVATLRPDQVAYALLCNERGGVVDDVTVYRVAQDAFLLCVNAATRAKDLAWIRRHAPADVRVRDVSAETALLALQGPESPEVLRRARAAGSAELRRYRFGRFDLAGRDVLISRTGYTGADGFEIYCAAVDAETLWDALLTEGESLGIRPVGLGARDTLRLEAALPLYGHELDDETCPLEAGLGRFVELGQRTFIGADALRRRNAEGLRRLLAGFALEGRGVAREGYSVASDGTAVGIVTSGAPSPTLGKSIGLAYLPTGLAVTGTAVDVIIRGRETPARVVETPFVRGAQAGRRTA